MNEWKIPLYKVYVDKEDVSQTANVIKRGNFWALGPEIENFENSLAQYVDTKYCVTFNSGTSALHSSLLSLNLPKQSEIIVPSFTFISTANSVLMSNLKPRFSDIEKSTYGLDPNLVQKTLTNATKAIIPVHYAGFPCDIQKLKQIAKKNNLILIEDAAESLGSTINNKKIGSIGDIGIFSFAGNKVLTTGEGGAVVTNSKTIYEKLKLIRSHGRNDTKNYFASTEKPNYVSLGFNWRMSSITAALGLSQLDKIEKLITLRRKNAKYLTDHLKHLEHVKTPFESQNVKHVYQMYTIELPSKRIRNKLKTFLQKKKIMSKVFFYPVHKTKYYQHLFSHFPDLTVTNDISDKVLSLPMYPGLTKDELNYICDSIDEFFDLDTQVLSNTIKI